MPSRSITHRLLMRHINDQTYESRKRNGGPDGSLSLAPPNMSAAQSCAGCCAKTGGRRNGPRYGPAAGGRLHLTAKVRVANSRRHRRGLGLDLGKRPERQGYQERAEANGPGADVEPSVTGKSVVDQASGHWPGCHAETAGHGRSRAQRPRAAH